MYYFGASSGDLTGVFVFDWICSILSGNEITIYFISKGFDFVKDYTISSVNICFP